MRDPFRISLNAVRVFISAAANSLSVTPSAVSHQIKNLEAQLGTNLFQRSNNAISLTDAGRRFLEEAALGVKTIERSALRLAKDENEVLIKVSISLAVRWLIPALEVFKEKHPLIRIRVETTHLHRVSTDPSVDLAIGYHRLVNPDEPGTPILEDFSRPVISPTLLSSYGINDQNDITRLPGIQCTNNNWDWEYWESHIGLEKDSIKIIHQFDTDDAALRAAEAGLGMVLAPKITTIDQINTGTLVEIPGYEPIHFGHFYLLKGIRQTRAVKLFESWLCEAIKNCE